jgi:DNA-binding transcriptional regulator YbjK
MYTKVPAKASPSTGERTTLPRRRRHGNERRQLLLDSTLRLIAGGGVDAVSHRAVAELAGVSLGSTTYWFASRQDMLREALEDFARTEIETLRERLSGVLGRRLSRRGLVDQFTAHLLAQLGEERWRTVAQYELLQEATRQPELERLCREWSRAWVKALTEVFESLGAEAPEMEARMFLALLDGLLVGELAAPSADVEQAVIRPALEAWFARVPKG